MEWKFKQNHRIGLLASAAAVALLSATPVFAAGSNTQSVTQTGVNDSETQVQQEGVNESQQVIYQGTVNSSFVPIQIYQLQASGSAYNLAAAEQYTGLSSPHGYGPFKITSGNYISQKQYSKSNYAGAYQAGSNNKITQIQNGGDHNYEKVGTRHVGGQYGYGNSAAQTQLGTLERAAASQYGNYNASTQVQNFLGTNADDQVVYVHGNNNIASQKQYSNSFQKIVQGSGYGNQANQFQAASSTVGSFEGVYQNGARNYALQKQYAGYQESHIDQFGGIGAKGNLAYTFQTGYIGNVAEIYQGEHGGSLGGDYNGRAYIDQFGAAASAGPRGNFGIISQYTNAGGTTNETARGTIKQGTAASPVYADYARIDQYAGYARATGTPKVYTHGAGYNYALAKQLGSEEYLIIRQMNSGASGNVAYTFQSGPGHGYSGVYQGGFNRGNIGNGPLVRFGGSDRPFDGTATGVTYHPNTPSFDQFATNDRAYIDQWNGAGATFGGAGNPNTNLAGIYQNTPNSTAVIVQGSKNAGVFGDTAKIYQCNGIGFACGSSTGGGGGTTGYTSRGRNAGNDGTGNSVTVPGGMYGNDVAKIYQQNNQEYAKIVQRGLNDYMSLTQTGIGNTFTLYQTGTNNHVVQVQH
jgi:hypothetical protein